MDRTDRSEVESGTQIIRGAGATSDAVALATFQSNQDKQTLITLSAVAQVRFKFPGRPEDLVKDPAQLAVEAFLDTLAACVNVPSPETLGDAMALANERIRQAFDLDGYGSYVTCAAIFIVKRRLYTIYIGHCRIYLLRDRQIHRLTRDHTTIQSFMDAGYLTVADLEGNHLDGMPLQRCLGSDRPAEGDFRLFFRGDESDRKAVANQGLRLKAGDQILLCSPELHGSVRTLGDIKDEQIREVWLRAPSPQAAAAALTDMVDQQRSKGYGTTIKIDVDGNVQRIPGKSSGDITAVVIKIPERGL